MGCTYQEYLNEPVEFVTAAFHWDKISKERAAADAKKQR